MQQHHPHKHQQQHGYPTPPHSPDFDSPLSSPPDSPPSRDSPPSPPSTALGATANVDAFDPLAGYGDAPAPAQPPTASAGGVAAGGAAPPRGAAGAGGGSSGARRASSSSVAGTGASSQPQPRRRSSAARDADFSSNGWEGADEAPAAAAGSSSRASGRRSSSSSMKGTGERTWTERDRRKAKMFPPSAGRDVLFETDEEWQEHHEKEQTSGWHHLPLVLVALPPLGAIVHGRAENWSDAIILLLICFYLYQLIKVPWELYYASHARLVLPTPSSSPSLSSPASLPSDPLSVERASSAALLRRSELLSLSLTFLVPALGASLLHYARGLLSDPERYINRSVIGLFCVAAGVRPLARGVEMWRKNALYHQALVHYPSSEVYQLRKRVETLERELKDLSPTFATRTSLARLATTVDEPLTSLSRAVRRFARQEEYNRLSADEKFAALVGEMDDVRAREDEREEEVELLRRRVEVSEASVGRVALQVARHLLVHLARGGGAGAREARDLGWYERGVAWYLFWPVNLPRAVVGWSVERALEAIGPPIDGKTSNGGAGGGGRRLAGGAGGRRRVEGPPSVVGAGVGGVQG